MYACNFYIWNIRICRYVRVYAGIGMYVYLLVHIWVYESGLGRIVQGHLCNSWHLPPVSPPFFLGWMSAFSPKLLLAVFVVHAKVGKLFVVGDIREGVLCDITDTYLLYNSPLLLGLVFALLHLRTGVICLGFKKGCVVVYMCWCVCMCVYTYACDMYLWPHACTVSNTYHLSSSDHGWKLFLLFFVKALSLESIINEFAGWMMVVRISGTTQQFVTLTLQPFQSAIKYRFPPFSWIILLSNVAWSVW